MNNQGSVSYGASVWASASTAERAGAAPKDAAARILNTGKQLVEPLGKGRACEQKVFYQHTPWTKQNARYIHLCSRGESVSREGHSAGDERTIDRPMAVGKSTSPQGAGGFVGAVQHDSWLTSAELRWKVPARSGHGSCSTEAAPCCLGAIPAFLRGNESSARAKVHRRRGSRCQPGTLRSLAKPLLPRRNAGVWRLWTAREAPCASTQAESIGRRARGRRARARAALGEAPGPCLAGEARAGASRCETARPGLELRRTQSATAGAGHHS